MRARRGRSRLFLLVPIVVLSLAAPAWGRHNFSMLKARPELTVPGGEVTVSGFSYPANAKVSIRFDALDGPVLAELEPNSNQDISGTVRIPEGAAPGRYVLYAVQYGAAGTPNRIPGRAAVTVAGGGGALPSVPTGLEREVRPHALAKSGGPGAGELALVALGALAVAAALSLIATKIVSRRPAAAS